MMDLDAYEEILFNREDSASTASIATLAQGLGNRLCLDADYRHTLLNPKYEKTRGAESDRANRAVVEQVLDPRTMAILYKLIKKGDLHAVNGCISTGKEANVYHATGTLSSIAIRGVDNGGSAVDNDRDAGSNSGTRHVAIKIYKSTILTFKNRDRYVQGEYRWRHGYCRSNPRKMVQMWAEKEMRNLRRLVAAGIRCPEPYILKLHVLVMRFIGNAEGWPAPRLKDAAGIEDYRALYYEAIIILRRLFHDCHLVHADFSEYNLLYDATSHGQHLVVIDVSQAVEHEHPRALDFLRADLANVVRFFGAERGVRTMRVKQLFEFVTRKSDLVVDVAYLDELHASTVVDAMVDEEVEMCEKVFAQSFIPRALSEVLDHERSASSEPYVVEKLAMQLEATGVDQGVDCEAIVHELAELRLRSPTDPVTREELRVQRKANKVQVKTERRKRRLLKSEAKRNNKK